MHQISNLFWHRPSVQLRSAVDFTGLRSQIHPAFSYKWIGLRRIVDLVHNWTYGSIICLTIQPTSFANTVFKSRPNAWPCCGWYRVGVKHHHVICRTCGRTVDVDCTLGETHCATAAADSGYQIEQAEVIYWGTCPECLAEKSGTGT